MVAAMHPSCTPGMLGLPGPRGPPCRCLSPHTRLLIIGLHAVAAAVWMEGVGGLRAVAVYVLLPVASKAPACWWPCPGIHYVAHTACLKSIQKSYDEGDCKAGSGGDGSGDPGGRWTRVVGAVTLGRWLLARRQVGRYVGG